MRMDIGDNGDNGEGFLTLGERRGEERRVE
jgi:hypothetical protein